MTSIQQVYQSLYEPNLVREALARDPDGEVRKAAKNLNLEIVLDSGKPPEVAIQAPAKGGASKDEVITASARIADAGGGIGRIEWRVNGVTVGVAGATPAPAADGGKAKARTITQEIALEPGENIIEVVAYNAWNLLASLPASTTVTWTPSGPQPRPRLFVVAVGIDDYRGTGLRSLRHAVTDAKALGAAMQAAGRGLYAGVDVTYVTSDTGTVTAARLERAIDAVGARMHPRDTFIFFAAGHGKAEKGRFHLIPQDFRAAPGRPFSQGSIGQDRLQDWFANRIKARRGLILLDTCESGALVAGRPSGVDAGNSEAALGRLNEATGRPVLTAAAADQVAIEGYKGPISPQRHGIFTYALLEGLIKGDTSNNGEIELSELTAHIQSLAPKLSRELRRRGRRVTHATRAAIVQGNASIAVRYADFRQKPRIGSRGEDFPLVKRLSALPVQ